MHKESKSHSLTEVLLLLEDEKIVGGIPDEHHLALTRGKTEGNLQQLTHSRCIYLNIYIYINMFIFIVMLQSTTSSARLYGFLGWGNNIVLIVERC